MAHPLSSTFRKVDHFWWCRWCLYVDYSTLLIAVSKLAWSLVTIRIYQCEELFQGVSVELVFWVQEISKRFLRLRCLDVAGLSFEIFILRAFIAVQVLKLFRTLCLVTNWYLPLRPKLAIILLVICLIFPCAYLKSKLWLCHYFRWLLHQSKRLTTFLLSRLSIFFHNLNRYHLDFYHVRKVNCLNVSWVKVF